MKEITDNNFRPLRKRMQMDIEQKKPELTTPIYRKYSARIQTGTGLAVPSSCSGCIIVLLVLAQPSN